MKQKIDRGIEREEDHMRQLIQEVKDLAVKKWSYRADSIGDMVIWWKCIGQFSCSFCFYFQVYNEEDDENTCGDCPLKDKDDIKDGIYGFGNGECCQEFFDVVDAVREEDVEKFNEAAEKLQEKIEKLEVEKEDKSNEDSEYIDEYLE